MSEIGSPGLKRSELKASTTRRTRDNAICRPLAELHREAEAAARARTALDADVATHELGALGILWRLDRHALA